jgi:hypothetical protein
MKIGTPRRQSGAGICNNPFARIHIPNWQTIDEALLFVIFLACSSPARFYIGPFVMGYAEPAVLVFILWRVLSGQRTSGSRKISGRGLLLGFWSAVIWIAVLWVLANNWSDRREGLFGWVLSAALLTVLLLQPPKNWGRIAILFVLASLPNLLVALYQRLMGIGIAPKDFIGWNTQTASTRPVMGFFGHPNDLATYLYWPFLLSVGLAINQKRWRRLLLFAIALFCGLILFWSVSRTILVTLCFVAFFTFLLLLVHRRRVFFLLAFLGFLAAAIAVIWIVHTQSATWISDILSGRPAIWQLTTRTIFSDPFLLPLGYLSIPPPSLPLLWIPHNIYLLAWLNYGIVGLLLLVVLVVYILFSGWQRYDTLRKNGPAALLWVGMAGLFLVNGLASLYFHENYLLLTFVSVLVLWVGLQ